jgi:DNA-binding GntR family transcriptional regulator
MIITQEIKSGQRIPEEAIAKVFGVSRTPIREALRELEKSGLVNIYPRKYAEVVRLYPEDKKKIGQLRIQLDSLSVRLLSESITSGQYSELKELAEHTVSFAEKDEIGLCFEADSRFHCKLAEYSGNKYLWEFVEKLDLKVQLLRNVESLSRDFVIEGARLHLPIIEAVNNHDPVLAEKLISEHLKKYYFND